MDPYLLMTSFKDDALLAPSQEVLEQLLSPAVLGFGDQKPENIRLVVAMSGGVDSSTIAGLLHKVGYDVVGITLRLYDAGKISAKSKTCCAGQDIYDAAQVAEKLGFPHYVLDYETLFRQAVIDNFADTYLRGQTPLPCVRCNQKVKFKDLFQAARDLGAAALVTGHYVQYRIEGGHGALYRGVDPRKDQSYYLFATSREQLDFLRFPLGGFTKDQTRTYARWLGIETADKPDSQDICFVPDGNYAGLVAKLRPGALDPGEIVDLEGNVVGRHQGIIHYTVGQRRGIDVKPTCSDTRPLYVIRLIPEKKQVIVGPREALDRSVFEVGEVNWLSEPLDHVLVKVRAAHVPVSARLEHGRMGGVRVLLDHPEGGIAPGQACVFYSGEKMVGGGWILPEEYDSVQPSAEWFSTEG